MYVSIKNIWSIENIMSYLENKEQIWISSAISVKHKISELNNVTNGKQTY